MTHHDLRQEAMRHKRKKSNNDALTPKELERFDDALI
jgi:hypothetical protein